PTSRLRPGSRRILSTTGSSTSLQHPITPVAEHPHNRRQKVSRSARSIEKCATSWQLSLLSQNKSPRTIETYLAAVQQFSKFLVDRECPTEVALIEREHVEAYIASLLEDWSDSTASVRYRALQQFFKWLLDEDEIEHSPMERTKAPTVREK